MYPRERFCTAPIVSLCRHPTNSNSIIVADLSQDVEPLLSWSEDQIREKLFAPGPIPDRPPLKEIKVNRCPFVVGIEVMDEENWSRTGIKRRDIDRRQRRLKQPGLAQKIMRVYTGRTGETFQDPDAALYDAFLQDADRKRCNTFLDTVRSGGWVDLDYADKRLHTLAARLKARSFPEQLSEEETATWRAFVAEKLNAPDAAWMTLPAYFAGLEKARAELSEQPASGGAIALLDDLEQHGRMLAERYAGTVNG